VESPAEQVSACGLSAVRTIQADLKLATDAPESERRLKLSNWITDPRNPLTARVMVNRIWHYHFGSGIVNTPNDFGYNGDRPSHPELLDWLASEFVKPGVEVWRYGSMEVNARDHHLHTSTPPHLRTTPWSLKGLHRLIMLSSTYRQSSAFSP